MSDPALRAVFQILARLIAILAARGILNPAEVLDLAAIAKRHAAKK
jgi:hypothetical protein